MFFYFLAVFDVKIEEALQVVSYVDAIPELLSDLVEDTTLASVLSEPLQYHPDDELTECLKGDVEGKLLEYADSPKNVGIDEDQKISENAESCREMLAGVVADVKEIQEKVSGSAVAAVVSRADA